MTPRVLPLLLLGLVACHGPWDDAESELRAARRRWEASSLEASGYDVRAAMYCFCPYTEDSVRLRVMADSIIEITFIARGMPVPATPSWRRDRYRTVRQLFDIIQDAIDREAASLEVSYDAEFGFPTAVSIDYAANVADEEIAYRLWEMQGVLTASLSRPVRAP